jgi:GTPase SAR1 family protein
VLIAQDWTERPKDLSFQIPPWLESSLKIAESLDIQEVAGELKALDARQKIPSFRLAFVGDFSRGKSTLINNLLALPLLPSRAIPTTATFTSLVAGEGIEEHMEVSFSNKLVESRPLNETAWHDLVANDLTDQAQKDIPRVQLLLNHPWLQRLDAEIIDTPGVDDLKSHRAVHVSEVLSECDAAVLVVSALLPFSLTEAAFLKYQLLGRHIPRVTVVVSKLDMLPEDQRVGQFETIQDRVAQSGTLVPVLPAYPIDANISESELLEALRSHIEILANKADRRAWRSQQVAATIADHLGQLIKIAQASITSAQMSEVKREEALHKKRVEARDAELRWKRIDLELKERCSKVDSQIRNQLHFEQENLQAMASSEFAKAPDPPLWWRRDFPSTLRQAFLGLEQKFQTVLMETLSGDAKWLQEEVTRIFDIHLTQSVPTIIDPITITLESREIRFDDINWKRLLIRIGAAAAAIAGALLLTSGVQGIQAYQALDILRFGGSVGQGVGREAEPFLGREVEQQRQRVYQEALRSIEFSIEEYASRMSARLHELYGQIASDMQREQSAWLAARNAALEAGGSHSDTTRLQEQIDKASTLQHTILLQLEE